MAILSAGDRDQVWADYMRSISRDREVVTVLKSELKAALDATDQWVSDNSASFNTAIPQPARAALTAAQKVRMLVAVLEMRYLKGV